MTLRELTFHLENDPHRGSSNALGSPRSTFRHQKPMLTPPSTGRIAPVTNFAAGDAR